MDKKQIILSFINKHGPSFPGQIYSELNVNLLMASAYMSEMSHNGELNISKVKVGGSPLYYINGQEKLLEKFIDKLHEKEKKAVIFLKEKQVLRDIYLEPLLRVSLRQTKDFAKPFYVKVNEKRELFWKWYLLKDKEVLKKKVLNLINISTNNLKRKKETNNPLNNNLNKNNNQQSNKSFNIPFNKSSNKFHNNPLNNPLISQHINKSQKQKDINPTNLQPLTSVSSPNLISTPSKFQEKTIKNIEQELIKGNIVIIGLEVIKKTKEYDLILMVPSALGKLKYYCKFWDKKKINDKDIDSIFVIGQMKKLPVVLISTGELTKKAQIKIDGEMQGIKFKKIKL